MARFQVNFTEQDNNDEDPNNFRDSLLTSSRECFSKHGIKKTTIEDICKGAKVSRPIFYRFFKNKQELLLNIAIEEMQRISRHGLKFQKYFDTIDEVIVEAILHYITEAQESDVVCFLLGAENQDLTLQVVESSSEIWRLQSLGWQSLLERAKNENRIHKNIDLPELAKWITQIQALLIIHSRSIKRTKQELRTQIEKFVLPSILTIE